MAGDLGVDADEHRHDIRAVAVIRLDKRASAWFCMAAHAAFAIAIVLWVCDPANAQTGALRYRLEVDAPEPLKGTISRNLDLVRWENYEQMTAELLDRLVVEAREQARQIAATEGYFEPRIGVDVDLSQDPALVRFNIDPGTPTRITRVDLALEGAVAADPALREQRLTPLQAQWLLPEGAIEFTK